MKGKNLTVLARKGYRASKGPDLAVVTGPEVAPLLLLERFTEANDVPMHVGTLRVATADAQTRTVLLARVPLSALTFDVPHEGAKPTARLTIVARVKDGKSEVVQYAGQTYDLTGQAGLTRAGAGDVLFYRDVTLPAGRLNLELVAFDAGAAWQHPARGAGCDADGTHRPSRRRSDRRPWTATAGRIGDRCRVRDAGAAVRRPGRAAQPR